MLDQWLRSPRQLRLSFLPVMLALSAALAWLGWRLFLQDRELAVQNLDRESTLARQLRSAIQRVDEGSYGVCLQCEEEIAPNRLKAIPWAEFCIRCQEQAERMGATRASFRTPDGLKQAA